MFLKIYLNNFFIKTLDFFTPYPEELFNTLVKLNKPKLILDIGSRDASQSKIFRNLLSDSKIIAIEPHPILFGIMKNDRSIKNLEIDIENFAISNTKGFLPFYINDTKSLNGSLRSNGNDFSKINIPVTTIDDLLEKNNFASCGMWIDAEGLGYEVLEGSSETLSFVNFLQIEFETKPLFQKQKTKDDIFNFLKAKGFSCISINYSESVFQGNALFYKKVGSQKLSFQDFKLLLVFLKLVVYSVYRKVFKK